MTTEKHDFSNLYPVRRGSFTLTYSPQDLGVLSKIQITKYKIQVLSLAGSNEYPVLESKSDFFVLLEPYSENFEK